MDLATGVIKVIGSLQTVFPLPACFRFTDACPQMYQNPSFHAKYTSALSLQFDLPIKSNLLWSTFSINLTLLIIIGTFQLCGALKIWHTEPDFERLGYYALLVSICTIAHQALSVVSLNIKDIIYLINQRLIIIRASSNNCSRNGILLGETFMYGFSAGLGIFPLVFAAIPLFRDYDCIQALGRFVFSSISDHEKNSLKAWTLKVLSCIYFFTVATLGAVIVLFVLLSMLLVQETCIRLSNNLWESKTNFKNTVVFLVRRQKNDQFLSCERRFRILQILFTTGNGIVSKFLAILTGMGITASSWGGFVMVSMYHELPLIIYMACSGVYLTCQVIYMLLVALAAIPNKNGVKFKYDWRGKLGNHTELRMIRSCPELGFSIGLLRNVKNITALQIFDTTINIIATLAIMKLNLKHNVNCKNV